MRIQSHQRRMRRFPGSLPVEARAAFEKMIEEHPQFAGRPANTLQM